MFAVLFAAMLLLQPQLPESQASIQARDQPESAASACQQGCTDARHDQRAAAARVSLHYTSLHIDQFNDTDFSLQFYMDHSRLFQGLAQRAAQHIEVGAPVIDASVESVGKLHSNDALIETGVVVQLRLTVHGVHNSAALRYIRAQLHGRRVACTLAEHGITARYGAAHVIVASMHAASVPSVAAPLAMLHAAAQPPPIPAAQMEAAAVVLRVVDDGALAATAGNALFAPVSGAVKHACAMAVTDDVDSNATTCSVAVIACGMTQRNGSDYDVVVSIAARDAKHFAARFVNACRTQTENEGWHFAANDNATALPAALMDGSVGSERGLVQAHPSCLMLNEAMFDAPVVMFALLLKEQYIAFWDDQTFSKTFLDDLRAVLRAKEGKMSVTVLDTMPFMLGGVVVAVQVDFLSTLPHAKKAAERFVARLDKQRLSAFAATEFTDKYGEAAVVDIQVENVPTHDGDDDDHGGNSTQHTHFKLPLFAIFLCVVPVAAFGGMFTWYYLVSSHENEHSGVWQTTTACMDRLYFLVQRSSPHRDDHYTIV